MDGRTGPDRIIWTPRTLTVLVSAFNQVQNLGGTIDRLLKALSITVEDFEIIIVNDGSSDGTGPAAEAIAAANPKIRVIHHTEHLGRGAAYQRGISEATKSFMVYIPGDNTWPYRSYLELFGNLGKADVITSYSANLDQLPWGRWFVSRMYTRTLNFLFRQRMRYYNGITIYPLSFLHGVPIVTTGFGFQAEILLNAIHQGLSVLEVALPLDEKTAGKTRIINFRNIANCLIMAVRMFGRLRLGLGQVGAARDASNWRSPANAGVEEMGLRADLNGKSPNGKHSLKTPCPANGDGKAPLTARPDRPLKIVITGVSSGIGAALCRALAADGHTVFGCARRQDKLASVFEGLSGCHAWPCDVGDEEQVKGFVRRVGAHAPAIDALINCAGAFGSIGPFESTDSEEWFQTLRVNLFGAYLMSKHFLPMLGRALNPRVINVAGGGAFSPFPNYSAYACSKAALVRFTECTAAELAPRGIAVNALAPGIVATEAHEATLKAGEAVAGPLQYRRTLAVMNEGGAPMGQVIDCTRALLSPQFEGLSGKTISANFDPWKTTTFLDKLQDITRSDLYTLRRYNNVNLPEGSLREALARAWANYATQM